MGDSLEPAKLAKYKHGSIVRIELNNFMIYEHVIFTPGPFLNLILGPNGSGKSAIVCSIIMGFAGDPQITGRSTHLLDYIRFGCQSASILIELYSGNVEQKNMTIERLFRVTLKNGKNDCQCSWKLNGRTVQKDAVLEFIRSLNIDINNLCQVLPQERVVEFSRLSAKDLLVSTEKSIGDVNMHERHMQLIDLSKDLFKLQSQIKNCNSYIQKYQSYKSNIEPDMKLVTQKKKFEEKIDWLKKKKAWVIYEAKREDYMLLKDEYMKKDVEHKEASKSVAPIRKKISDCQEFFKKLQNQKGRSSAVMDNSRTKISNCCAELKKLATLITREIDSFNDAMKNEKQNKERLVQLEADKRNFESELENCQDDDQFEAKVEEITRELGQIETELRHTHNQYNSKKGSLEKLEAEKRGLSAKMSQIRDIFNQRLCKISEHDSSTKIACTWLKENRSTFRGAVFDPIITQVNVLKPEWAVFVESAIPGLDMSTFLFELKEDLRAFCEGLRRAHKIRVNVAMLPRDMSIDDCNRTFSLQQFAPYGIFASVRDLFNAPEPVMVYLCKSYNLHRIPVGNDLTERKVQGLMDNSDFRKIFTSKNMFSIIVSKYDHTKTTRVNPIRFARFLNVILNEKEMHDTQAKLNLIGQDLDNAKVEMEKCLRDCDKLKESKQMKRDVYQSFQKRQSAIELHQERIKEKERQIEAKKKELASIEILKDKVTSKLHQMHSKQLHAMDQAAKAIKSCVEHTCSEILFTSKITRLKDHLRKYNQMKATHDMEVESIKQELENFRENLYTARNAAKEARDSAKEITGMDFNRDVPEEITNAFNDLPDTVSELDHTIDVMRLRCEGVANIDDSVLEEYQKYQREIAEKTVECRELELELVNVEREIQNVKPLWLKALNTLIVQINQNFGKFMFHLSYSGEVYLFEGNKEYAFEDYGIKIRVKFREGEQMKDLDAYHQSGGERSVSTMVYMLSLQELANVPFRVVDEINQGMDDRNERLVFDLISTVSQRNSSQYFLLSPKLLPRLNYSREMTIHIIMNGAYVFADVHKMMKQLAKTKTGAD